MTQLSKALLNQGGSSFNDTLKTEIEHLDASQLPLQAGLSQSSYVSDEPFRVMVISTSETDAHIQVRAGIFYTGIIAGCNCSDDPTPVDVLPEYCEVALDINKRDGETIVTLISE
ncbi:hypothetical protein MNBD_GAMMA15-1748 [hydrothermal vent metagenome]|uniref:Uncharacterized protein n=1 Tax=hydrothermal vent metagenome TaxID=652676 RepID=A0A3B0YB84_9ZZZZ